jgi:hypothetical protein
MVWAVSKWYFWVILDEGIGGTGGHESVTTRVAFGFTRSFDKKLHMIHTRAFEPVCYKVAVSF